MHSRLRAHAQKTTLTESERAVLRERVLTYMEYHPRQYAARARSSPFALGLRLLLNARALGAVSVALLAVLVVVPYAAENSKPGDLLYAVKTRVNEPLRAVAVTTPNEKITFETKLLERRIAEAKLLVEEGRLDAGTEATLSENIKKHSAAIQKNIEELKETDREDAVVAQTEFTSMLATTDTIVSAITADISSSTNTLKQVVADAKTTAEQRATSTDPDATERVAGHVEQELARAYELRASVEQRLSDAERAEVAVRFTEIEHALRDTSDTPSLQHSMVLDVASTTSATTTFSDPVPQATPYHQILTNIKTLVVYLTDTSLRPRLTKETPAPLTETSATSTDESGTTSSTSDVATSSPAR